MAKFCHHYNFNNGVCPYGDNCTFEHKYVKKAEKDRIPKPRRSPSDFLGRSPGRDKGKGKGKSKGKGGNDGAANPNPRGRSPARKTNLFCGRFLKTGKCHLGDQCPDRHMNAEEVQTLKGLYGEHFEGYYKAGQGQ